jgi:regulator of protease activity HflC (stomatin/prohibitin superfamily)
MRRALLLVAALAGCNSYKTGETEVGVLVCKLALGCESQGVQKQIYPPGSTNFFAPFIRDFYTFDVKIQNLEMTANVKQGDREGVDDLRFKTTDGNDIAMDVTVVWQVDPAKAPDVLMNVGPSTREVNERLVRPMARTVVRDVLNELDSESVYNADKRFQKAEEARTLLSERLSSYGVMVSQVILHEHRFNPAYEKIIHDRKLAEQRASQLKSTAEAAEQEALANLETAKGTVNAKIADATGKLSQAKLTADAQYIAAQQNAEAITTERAARAQAIAKKNEALRGAGGRAMVKLKLAEALTGKSIILIPGGASGVGINKLDVNALIKQVMAEEANH